MEVGKHYKLNKDINMTNAFVSADSDFVEGETIEVLEIDVVQGVVTVQDPFFPKEKWCANLKELEEAVK